MQSVDVDGQRIAYERAAAGAPIALVHGYVGDGPSIWRPQLDRLAGVQTTSQAASRARSRARLWFPFVAQPKRIFRS